MNKIELALIKNYVDAAIDNVSLTSGGSSITDEEVVEIIEENLSDSSSLLATAINAKENTSNKATSLSSSSTDTQYPSAKLVYDSLDLKADLNSPALTGVPTAPTAVYGTNTTQIATTAFVQQAVKPSLLVTVTDIPANTVVTVTATLVNSNPLYSVTATLNSSGVTLLNLNYTGEYSIIYNNAQVVSISSINISTPSIYNLNGYWAEKVTYTLLIDTTNSNPETACTYSGSNSEMTKGSLAWDNMPIFKNIKPCVFQSGQVNYYLNPNNWNQKIDGTVSDLTGTDGDVMIEFPKFAYKIKKENDIITVSVSTDDTVIENDSDYTYDAFSRLEEGDLEYFYKGAFKGSIDGDGKLRSIAGVVPNKASNLREFRAAAQLNGAHYQQSTYAQLKALQCLYLIKYGNRNGQTAIGKGVTNASEKYITGYNTTAVDSISSENSTLSSGMTFGTTANGTTHMRLFGIEDFWGNINEWVDGCTSDSNWNIITSWNDFSNEGITATTISTPSGLTANSSGFSKDVIGNTNAGFLPKDFDGSDSTYWPDQSYLYSSKNLFFGGHWNQNKVPGPFCLRILYNYEVRQDTIGARLSYV